MSPPRVAWPSGRAEPEASFRHKALWRAVQGLPEPEGRAIRLHFQEGRDLDETAAALGLTRGRTESVIRAGLARLKVWSRTGSLDGAGR
jgi:DNA-directed RNA polymerase specialized sigma24 family protein